ncbi:MAG: ABC transporter ATP-binding protein [Leucobacter sp.]
MISLDDVTFSYDAPFGEPQVRSVTLEIPHGQHVALLGSNGSGKSTLARLMNGLLVPQIGQVTVDGQVTAGAGVDPAAGRRARAAVGLVFQNPENQQVGTTVYEDIAFGLANHGVQTDQMVERALQALDLVGLDIDLDRKITSLSGGQLQRQALASVLALEPRYLVLDEATSMLDPAGREQLLVALRGVKERVGIGIVQISHYLDEIVMADRAVVVIDGQIACDTTPKLLLSDPEMLSRAGLERPRTGVSLIDLAIAARPGATAKRGAQDDAPVFALRDATFTYDRGRRKTRAGSAPFALQATDFELWPGELVAITGPSGAGKTTLLNLIKGVSKPTSGDIEVAGTDPWQRKHRGLFSEIGYVLQHPEHQLFATTVRGDIGFGLRGTGLRPEQIATRAAEQLEKFGLSTDKLEVSPFSLSGGQQRRVAMAGVFINYPRIILLDEPTAGLDSPSRDLLFETIHRERLEGAAVVWVSHRLEEIASHASRLVVLQSGRVIANDAPERVFGDTGLVARLGWSQPAEGATRTQDVTPMSERQDQVS